MLKEFELGSEAITYIRSQLSTGDTLSTYLLGLPLEGGRVVTSLPATATPAAIGRFEQGGVAKTSETEPHLLAFIKAHLSGQGKRYAVFETLGRPSDPYLSLSKERFFIIGPEVYYFLTSQDCEWERIGNTVRSARHYPFVGVLTSVPEDEPSIRSVYELSVETLEKIAARTEYILIGAYDAEGTLIWSRS